MTYRKAGRRDAIVTGRAVIDDTGVIEHRRRKGAGHVTDIAILVCRNVVGFGALADCDDTIMAGIATITHHRGTVVINKGRRKNVGIVAYPAILSSRDMITRLAYRAGCIKVSIMAGGTITRDTRVIENMRWEPSGRMTNGTILVGRQVVCVLIQNWRVVR